MSEPRTVIDRAYAIWAQARAQYPEDRIRGVADPFGNSGMPLCRWRVSWDVMQQLTEAMPPPYSAPNPKSSYGEVKLLLGWPIDVDKSAPAGTMQLVEVGDPPAPLILHPESVLHPEDEEPSCCEELLAAERTRIRAAVEGLEPLYDRSGPGLYRYGWVEARAAVLEILDAATRVTTHPASPERGAEHE